MPRRSDISKILIIGSGPIIIGQACEFDYSGTQAIKALKEEGYEVILVNSNPATIMTDPSLADKTYIEPLTVEVLTKVIDKECPDALLPTLGGQTGLNLAMALHREGVLARYNVAMLGASHDVIDRAEDRQSFKEIAIECGLDVPKSFVAHSLDEAKEMAKDIGFPLVVRPAFTMGGTGGGIAFNIRELEEIASSGLRSSYIKEILIEESILGWKEYELEVMRDHKDNVVIVCSIENVDPVGVHTGDSITVAPAQTLTNPEYQAMRDGAIAIMRKIGVETGGSNVQFAVHPKTGRMIVIEMNPRVSRSSALASKATGFPIAKFAAKLAVGYTLDELQNDITRETPACFEPTIDYCVVKIPRFNFEKFPASNPVLGVSMKSVGEAMSIGRTFKEAIQKGLRSLETKRFGFGYDGRDLPFLDRETLLKKLSVPTDTRIFYIKTAFENGLSLDEVYDATKIDPWFLYQMQQIVSIAPKIEWTPASIRKAKEYGFSDVQLSVLLKQSEASVRAFRKENGILPTYKLVDTCAAEFEAFTPYFYSTYETEDESRVTDKKKIMILGGGPNRIGQGIEFDYCCVHACYTVREEGYESIMVNSNPETVSTDYDTADKLYFEPLTLEDVLNIYENEKPEGVIVQFGGQTPLNLSKGLEANGVKILGTSTDSIDRAEDRDRFQKLIESLNLKQPENGMAVSVEDALAVAHRIGYPVLLRPSYVLGGASMEIVYDDDELTHYMKTSTEVSADRPVLIDDYLEGATELDVDAVSDGTDCKVAGIMEHIEAAGVHSGDSACVLPTFSISPELVDAVRHATKAIAKELNVIGLLNIQFAIKDDILYVLEVNPRGSRTVPFVSKATNVPWAKIATKLILGKTIAELGLQDYVPTPHYSVKEAVFPFNRFPGVDIILGPEMKSTGEVMGIDASLGIAFIKSQMAAGSQIPMEGTCFVSVMDKDKPLLIPIVKGLQELGFRVIATYGTCDYLKEHGLECAPVKKVRQGRPHIVDHITNGDVQLIINTPNGKHPRKDEIEIRSSALRCNVPVITTMEGATATLSGLLELKQNQFNVQALQLFSQPVPTPGQ